MAIDPDVNDLLININKRLDILEAAMVTPAPNPSPVPTPLPTPTPSPTPKMSIWESAVDAASITPKVTLPQVPTEPQAATGIDAESAGVAAWNGRNYTVVRDWDEDVEGKYLIFTRGQIDWAGHTLTGVHQILNKSIESLGRRSANSGGGTGKRILVTNPNQVVVSDVFNHGIFDIAGATLLDAIGDTWRALTGSSLTDAFIRVGMIAGTSTGQHYDGAQFHNSRNAPIGHDRANQTMKRIVFAGVPKAPDGAPLGAPNSMIFFQSDNLDGATVEDILVLDASGIWFPLKFVGTGMPTLIKNLQLTGTQGPPQGKPNKLAPKAFILAPPRVNIDLATVYVDAPGVLKRT